MRTVRLKMVRALHYFGLRFLLLLTVGLVITPDPGWALEPNEVLVVANRKVPASVRLATYYMQKRGVPEDNLVKLWVQDDEDISREDYEKRVARPVRRYLNGKDPFMLIRCLLITYGLPLRVGPSKVTSKTKAHIRDLETTVDTLHNQMKAMKENHNDLKALEGKLARVEQKLNKLKGDEISALDSELALVLEDDYPLAGWVPSPLFLGNRGKRLSNLPPSVLMVSRLDGPSEETARRLIDDSLSVEEKGLRGTAYFDARWPEPSENKTSAYAFYDKSIHKAARLVRKSKTMPTVVDDQEQLFHPGDCPGAAIYCGWYSLAKYVDAFKWQPGAVGYHIASSECTTLRRRLSRVWCKMMLENGAAATLGPVGEPYVQAFPPPELFFGLLIQGQLTLAECYALANPFWSWKMVLIGDPLYRPFKNH